AQSLAALLRGRGGAAGRCARAGARRGRLPDAMNYLAFDAAEIVDTIERLRNRIEERFPNAGLGKVCGQLLEIAQKARERADWIARPILAVRIATVVL